MPINFDQLPDNPLLEDIEAELDRQERQPPAQRRRGGAAAFPSAEIDFIQVLKEAAKGITRDVTRAAIVGKAPRRAAQIVGEEAVEAVKETFKPVRVLGTEKSVGEVIREQTGIEEKEIRPDVSFLQQLGAVAKDPAVLKLAAPGGVFFLSDTDKNTVKEAAIRSIAELTEISPGEIALFGEQGRNVKAVATLLGKIPVGKTTLGKLVTTNISPTFLDDAARAIKTGELPAVGKGGPLGPTVQEIREGLKRGNKSAFEEAQKLRGVDASNLPDQPQVIAARTQEAQRIQMGIRRLPVNEPIPQNKALMKTIQQDTQQAKTLKELNELSRKAELIEQVSKEKFIEVGAARTARINQESDILVKTMQGGDPTKPPPPVTTANQPGPLGKAARTFRASLMRPTRIFDMLDNKQNFQGPTHRLFYDKVNRATNLEINNVSERTQRGLAILQENGLKPKMFSKKQVIDGIEYTKDDLMEIYGARNDSQHLAALEFGNNFPRQVIERVTNGEFLSEAERNVADRLVAEMQLRYGKVRETLLEITDGKNDLGRIPGRVPIVRDASALGSTEKELNDELLLRQSFRKTVPPRGFTKERVDVPEEAQTRIRTGLWRLFNDEISRTEKFIATAPVIRDINAIMANPKWAKTVRDRFGQETLRQIQDWVGRVANPNIYRANTAMAKTISTLRQNTAIAVLGLNLLTMSKQAPSYFLFLNEMGPVELMAGTQELMSDFRNKIKFVQSKDPQMKNRAVEREIEEFKRLNKTEFDRVRRKIGLASMKGIMFIDQVITHAGWLSKYNQMRKLGFSDTEAIEEAQKVVLRTQPAAAPKDIPGIFSDQTLTLFTQFQNQLNQIGNIIFYDIPARATSGRQQQALLGGIGVAMSAMSIWILSNGRIPRDLEDISDVGFDQLNTISVAGPLINGSRKGFDGLPPTFRPLAKAGEFGRAIQQGRTGRAILSAGEATALTAGIPVVQTERAIRFISDFLSGKSKDIRRLAISPTVLERGTPEAKQRKKERRNRQKRLALARARAQGDEVKEALIQLNILEK